ncbi:MAG: M1 family metallopeptidase, partial [bacterium]
TLEGQAFEPDDRAKLHVFVLETPLAPGDTVRVGFSHEGRFPKGFTKNGGGLSTFILPAGVVLTSFEPGFVPVPFFEEGRGVDEDNDTEPKDYPPDFWEGRTPPAIGSGVRFPVRTKITGPAEYAYHAVGVLMDEKVENGRRTVVWESDFPVNFFNVVAGKWAVWEGEGVSVHYHPDHTYNIESIGETLVAARKKYSEWFYPYPWRDLRLNEFPALASYAQGFPTNITFSENIGFLTRATSESDAPFLVTAHEAAHQWWGNILMPGEGPGGEILAEGMAHFSAVLLFGEVKGEKERIEFCKRIEEEYGNDRSVDTEKALVWTRRDKETDTTVLYDKGGWVFWMLHRLMGEEASFAGLKDFIALYQGGPDYPLLQDFVRVMRTHAPDPAAFDVFVEQWFFEVVVPEYVISTTALEAVNGTWKVTATVENKGTGRMPVEVCAFRGKRFEEDGEWQDARAVVELGAGEKAEVEIACDFQPEKITLDPDATVLMLARDKVEKGL